MSSPASRRGRPSKSTASPVSSAREPPSSPSQQQATPRAARRLAAERGAPSSSPMFFQSSPTRSNRGAETPDVRMAEASSTVDDGERTPRANNAGIRGRQKKKKNRPYRRQSLPVYFRLTPTRLIPYQLYTQFFPNPRLCPQ